MIARPSSQSVIWTWEVHSNYERADTAIHKALEEALKSSSKTSHEPFPLLTRSQIKRLIEEGKITLNGASFKSSNKLKAGSFIRIEFPPPIPLDLVPENRPLEILFEDE